MRTFHEQEGSDVPFRLSYHGRSHYNSIIPLDWNYDKVFISSTPGEAEDEAIKMSRLRDSQSTDTQHNLPRDQKITE